MPLEVAVQAVTELDNKAIQGRLPIKNGHGPFLRGLLDCQEGLL